MTNRETPAGETCWLGRAWVERVLVLRVWVGRESFTKLRDGRASISFAGDWAWNDLSCVRLD
jgi:hypothetical protein